MATYVPITCRQHADPGPDSLGRQFLNTVVFTGGVTAVSLLLDSLANYALARMDFPAKNAVFIWILLC